MVLKGKIELYLNAPKDNKYVELLFVEFYKYSSFQFLQYIVRFRIYCRYYKFFLQYLLLLFVLT